MSDMTIIREQERHYGADPHRPDLFGILLPGKRGRLLARLFTAAGEGPHPTVLQLHGIPGTEQNLDLCQALRRAGFHVLTFHYSGSWGSDGDYALAHNLEDSNTALDFILQDTQYGFDKEHIFAVGHSLGGFAAGQLIARRPEVKGGVLLMPCDIGRMAVLQKEAPAVYAGLRGDLADVDVWLRGTTIDALLQEAADHADEYALPNLGRELAKKPLLCVSGDLDTVTPDAAFGKPLRDAVAAAGGTLLKHNRYPTDHSFADYRLTVARDVADFLRSLL